MKKLLCTWSKSVHFKKDVVYGLSDLEKASRIASKQVLFHLDDGKYEYVPVGLTEIYATFEVVNDDE